MRKVAVLLAALLGACAVVAAVILTLAKEELDEPGGGWDCLEYPR